MTHELSLAGAAIASTALYYGLKRYKSECRVKIHGTETSIPSTRTLLNEHCPSLASPSLAFMVPTPYLPTGILQTAFCSLQTLKRDTLSDITYDRELLTTPDQGTVSLDWYAKHKKGPISIIMAGIGGSSYEYHIRCLVKALSNSGFRAVVMNHRGLGRTPLTSSKLYNAQDTSDFTQSLHHIRDTHPEAPIVGVAFSMGAMLLTKYMGETGSSSLLSAAIAVSCPFDLLLTGRQLDRDTFLNNNVFQPLVVASQLRVVKRNYDMIKSDPLNFDMDALLNAKRVSEIDTLVTARTLGFKDCWELYASGSTTGYVDRIRTPFLVINSMDDNVVPAYGLPIDKIENNPYTALALVKHGGHLGFFTGLKPRIWYLTPVVEFLTAAVPQGTPGKAKL
ncbi:hypothetical protein IWW37_004306 [Coemansia sp. RSA 2050]|nr:hypothetical protein IWW37_004306 [Coemansia sp. RSA 2050]KAJ2731709.1 hypothetical protein IW152_004356 [Coemansia sp. BCRC 34962]